MVGICNSVLRSAAIIFAEPIVIRKRPRIDRTKEKRGKIRDIHKIITLWTVDEEKRDSENN